MEREPGSLEQALAELQADSRFKALSRREQNFLVTFLTTVTGDRFADGANFHNDLRSYGYKNVAHLLRVFNTHYPNFVKFAGISERWLETVLCPSDELTRKAIQGLERGLSKAARKVKQLLKKKKKFEEEGGKPPKIPEGTSALLGELETLLEEILEKLGWDPAVHVSKVKEGIQAILEDWSRHDPAVGIYGGTEGRVVFDFEDDEDLNMKFRWESHVDPERRDETETAFWKNKGRIINALMTIRMGR